MHTKIAVPSVPVVRALMIAPWVASAQSLGAPAEVLLGRAGIRSEVLRHATAAVPLKKLFCWIELVCQSLGTEHLGLDVGCATRYEDFGHYGRMVLSALTLREYLQKGISLYGTVVVGQSFWLSAHGAQVRLNLSGPWDPELGDYQSYLNSFAIIIASIRRFAGPGWAPTEISFGFRAREADPGRRHLRRDARAVSAGTDLHRIPAGHARPAAPPPCPGGWQQSNPPFPDRCRRTSRGWWNCKSSRCSPTGPCRSTWSRKPSGRADAAFSEASPFKESATRTC